MLELDLVSDSTREFRILCLGAHCDDIEIGCGGTLLQLAQTVKNLSIHWVVFSSTPQRAQEARNSANAFLYNVPQHTIRIHEFRDGFFPSLSAELKECFEQLKLTCSPDVIFTHYRKDLHQDHRMIAELTWNTFRRHLILEYEIPKYDGDFGTPNTFVPLADTLCQEKIRYLMQFYESQRNKPWFCPDLFSAVLRLRGMEADASTRYAEAFYCRKIRLRVSS